MLTSQNGYPANDATQMASIVVPGTTIKIRVRKGVVGQLLAEFASRFDAAVEDVDTIGTAPTDPAPAIPGAGPSRQADDWSYAERPIRGSSTQLSNHASGTAIDLNATQHPLGVAGTYSAAQLARLHALLREFADPTTGRPVLRAGEDYTKRKDGMHFEVIADERAVTRALAAYRVRRAGPKPVAARPIVKPAVKPAAKPAAKPATPVRPGPVKAGLAWPADVHRPWLRAARRPV